MLDAWYAATGTPPADDRFDTAKITDPLDKQLYEFNTTGHADLAAELLPAAGRPERQRAGPAAACSAARATAPRPPQIRERAAEQWRAQKPDELKNWQAFKPRRRPGVHERAR